jgi:two-component system OmpR family sensor kinase
MPPADVDPATPAVPRRRRFRRGFRTRVLGFATLLLVGATGLGLVAQRTVLYRNLDADVAARLDQERAELSRLADGIDPATGEPFGTDVAAIFDTYLARNVADRDEAFLTIVDGKVYRSTAAPASVNDVDGLIEGWAALEEGERGSFESDAGLVRYVAVPLASDGTTHGVFVAAMFIEPDRKAIDDHLRVQALVVAVVVALAIGVAWVTASRLLRPLRAVTAAARTITETGLDRRIDVDSDDEVGELAVTFNQMLDRLQAAFAAQRTFIDDAGHELRTPITVIMGQLELMGDDPGDRARTLAVVDDELQRMSRMVDDLLLLAKAEQPDFVEREPVELSDFTTELLVKARTLGDRGWRLDECAVGMVDLDPQRLTQAMLNLARNAVEHTDPGTEVAIGSARLPGEVRLWVRDAGAGVAVEDEERIFGRFSRGGAARRRSDGAGLGLAIVTAVAEAHEGRVVLDNRPGEGARFELRLPVLLPEPDEHGVVDDLLLPGDAPDDTPKVAAADLTEPTTSGRT